jgi:hypothetical protein
MVAAVEVRYIRFPKGYGDHGRSEFLFHGTFTIFSSCSVFQESWDLTNAPSFSISRGSLLSCLRCRHHVQRASAQPMILHPVTFVFDIQSDYAEAATKALARSILSCLGQQPAVITRKPGLRAKPEIRVPARRFHVRLASALPGWVRYVGVGVGVGLLPPHQEP